MSTDLRSRTGIRWAWLPALPVLCCVGHAVLLALGVGSLAAVTGAATRSVLLAAAGALLAAAAVIVLLRRTRQR